MPHADSEAGRRTSLRPLVLPCRTAPGIRRHRLKAEIRGENSFAQPVEDLDILHLCQTTGNFFVVKSHELMAQEILMQKCDNSKDITQQNAAFQPFKAKL